MTNLDDLLKSTTKPEYLTVVRVTTDYWHDKNGAYTKKSIKYLKRKSYGFNILDNDCDCGGSQEVIGSIINLYDVDDGLYTIHPCNESRDFESGYIDSYDLQLLPYEESLK